VWLIVICACSAFKCSSLMRIVVTGFDWDWGSWYRFSFSGGVVVAEQEVAIFRQTAVNFQEQRLSVLKIFILPLNFSKYCTSGRRRFLVIVRRPKISGVGPLLFRATTPLAVTNWWLVDEADLAGKKDGRRRQLTDQWCRLGVPTAQPPIVQTRLAHFYTALNLVSWFSGK